jgi:catechol 2,3-dioxygenase-like lactoylglutathione lyase family enzyme
VRTHLNFGTVDLAKSVKFYSTLLDAKPAKLLGDYALFITDQPGLELALALTNEVSPTRDAHYGVYVETEEDVERAIARLEQASLASSIEREETCCYANQTKVWTVDPEGRRWEIYTVHAETEERDDTDTTCCSGSDETLVCCVE